MKVFLFWALLSALIVIHAIDMELTTHHIGNQWEHETFPLMRVCIKEFGIHNAVWISRICTYVFFLICYIYRQNDKMLYIMFLITVLYYLAMVDWLFNLGIAKFPYI